MFSGDIVQTVVSILIAAVIGCLAGLFVGGGGTGILGNAFFGTLGSLFASWLFPTIGISIGGQFGGYIEAVIGAAAVILIFNLICKIIKKLL